MSVVELSHRSDWVTRAACRGASSELFYAPANSNAERAALGLCRSCTVRRECLDAVIVEEGSGRTCVVGVRGGETAEHRRAVHDARTAAR